MAEIKLFEGHVESIKELRKQLSDLKDAYAALASEETKDTDKMAAQLNEVAKAQDLLNDVMGNTRNAVSEADRALAQNYNTMQIGDKTVNQLRADLKMLTAVLNDTKPGPGWDELNQKVLEVNNALKGMEQSHGDFRRSVGSYAKIFDNFEQGANQVKQAGADIQGALGAIAGAMNLTKEQQDDLNGAMNQFRSALQVIGGAKGLAGLLKNLKTWLTTTKAQTTAQKAQNAGINGFTAATKAATVAEGKATVATSIWSAVLNALPFVAIATAIGVLITHFEDVVGWIQKAMQSIGLFSKEEDKSKTRVDEVNKKLDERNKALERKQKLEKAQGATNKQLLKDQKEELQNQIKMIEAEKADIQLRIQKLDAQNAWVKFWNRSNKKIKEETENMSALDEIIKSLKENIKDIDIDIKVEDITAGQNAANNRAKALEQQNEELKKAAEKAASEIQKINDARDRTEIEKIEEKYKKIGDILAEGQKSEIALASGATAEIAKINEKYAEAEKEMNVQKNREIEESYRNMLLKNVSATQAYSENIRSKAKGDWDYYHLLEEEFQDDQFDIAANVEQGLATMLKNLKEDFKNVLDNVKEISKDDFEELAGMTNEYMQELYAELLKDEDKFVKDYGQPFSEALKILVQNLDEQAEVATEHLKADMVLLKEQVFREMKNGNSGNLQESLLQVIGLGEGAGPREKHLIDEWVKDIKKEYVDAVMGSENPLEMNGYFFKWLTEVNQDMIDEAKFEYSSAMHDLEGLVSGTAEYELAITRLKDAEYQLHVARMNQWESWAQVAGKYMETYGKATENLLGNIAGYWENNIKLKEQDIKKQLEQGKITQAEYDRQHKRNDDAFKQMKKLQIATALISTASAVVQALADPTVPSYYVKLANAIAAGLAGAAQIATINATSLDNAEGGGNKAPQLVDRSATVQVQSMNPADYQQQNQEPIKVYVTDSDIEEGLNRRRARIEETTW